jgi:hypothetical protein
MKKAIWITAVIVTLVWIICIYEAKRQYEFETNPERACIEYYGNGSTRHLPVKCLKYFK